jgi:hypothetical protein
LHRPAGADLDVKPQLIAESLANTRYVIFYIHFVPDFIPGFDFSYALPPSRQRRLSAPQIIFDPLPPVAVRLPPHRSVTALAPETASPAPSLRRSCLSHAITR